MAYINGRFNENYVYDVDMTCYCDKVAALLDEVDAARRDKISISSLYSALQNKIEYMIEITECMIQGVESPCECESCYYSNEILLRLNHESDLFQQYGPGYYLPKKDGPPRSSMCVSSYSSPI